MNHCRFGDLEVDLLGLYAVLFHDLLKALRQIFVHALNRGEVDLAEREAILLRTAGLPEGTHLLKNQLSDSADQSCLLCDPDELLRRDVPEFFIVHPDKRFTGTDSMFPRVIDRLIVDHEASRRQRPLQGKLHLRFSLLRGQHIKPMQDIVRDSGIIAGIHKDAQMLLIRDLLRDLADPDLGCNVDIGSSQRPLLLEAVQDVCRDLLCPRRIILKKQQRIGVRREPKGMDLIIGIPLQIHSHLVIQFLHGGDAQHHGEVSGIAELDAHHTCMQR